MFCRSHQNLVAILEYMNFNIEMNEIDLRVTVPFSVFGTRSLCISSPTIAFIFARLGFAIPMFIFECGFFCVTHRSQPFFDGPFLSLHSWWFWPRPWATSRGCNFSFGRRGWWGTVPWGIPAASGSNSHGKIFSVSYDVSWMGRVRAFIRFWIALENEIIFTV